MPSVSEMDGMFKQVYADKISSLTPNTDLLAKDIEFVPQDQQEGNTWNLPVVVSREHGWTLNTDGSAFSLNAAISAISKNASVGGAAFCLRSSIAYTAITKSSGKSESAKRKAFVDATSYTVQNMTETASYVRECQLLYGDSTSGNPAAYDGLGAVASKTGSAGVYVCTLTAASWAPGLWAGAENMKVDVYSTGGTKRNTANDVTVTAVDFANRTVTLTGTESEVTNIAATDIIFFRGGYRTSFAGLFHIGNASGSIFGIDNSVYALWKASTYSAASGSLTFAKAMVALNRPAGLGLKGNVNLYVSIPTWTDLGNDLAQLRRFADKAGGKVEQGAKDIVYHSHTGTMTVKPHIYMKSGYALAFDPDKVSRVGSTDITFEMPGSGQIFFDNPSIAGKEIRNFWHQGIIHQCPAQMVVIDGIINSADAS